MVVRPSVVKYSPPFDSKPYVVSDLLCSNLSLHEEVQSRSNFELINKLTSVIVLEFYLDNVTNLRHLSHIGSMTNH